MLETWKTVNLDTRYQYIVSDTGKIARVLTQGKTPNRNKKKKDNNYLNIQLAKTGGGHLSRLMHRLVLKAFVGEPKPDEVCNHKDGNKANNNLENLEWVTRSENQKHAYETGLQEPVVLRGEKHWRWKGGSPTTSWRRKQEAK